MTFVMTPGKAFRRLAAAGARSARRSRDEPGDLGSRHEPLAARSADGGELPVALPPPEGLDPNADRLRRLPDPIPVHSRRSL